MKLTKVKLKQLLEEELKKILKEDYYAEAFKKGDLLELDLSTDGYDVSVAKYNEEEYTPRNGTYGFSMVVQIVMPPPEATDEY
jgi:hypothetical protein